jgi:SAM domain (Sterile alpha motif)
MGRIDPEGCEAGQTSRTFFVLCGEQICSFAERQVTQVSEDIMEVAIRLQALDLERHQAAFPDNLIDMDVVHELNENHLENLGLALGDRKRVQEAIAEKNPTAQPSGRVRAS